MNKKEFKKEVTRLKLRHVLNILNNAEKLKIKYKFIRREGNRFYYKLFYKNKHVYVCGYKIYFNINRLCSALTINKDFTKIVLDKKKIKVPQGVAGYSLAEIKKKFKQKKLEFPIVLKPNSLLEGIGVSVNLKDWPEVEKAFAKIKKIKHSRKTGLVIAEEYFPGRNFRVLVLNGKSIACTERTRPEVVGDGKNNINQLIKLKFKNRPAVFSTIDQEIKDNLRDQKVSLKTVLPLNKKIYIRYREGLYAGGLAINYTEKIAPKFKKIAESCAKELNVDLAGIDIMSSDITDPKADYRVIEVNNAPEFLELHDNPTIGKSEKVTQKILKAIFNIK